MKTILVFFISLCCTFVQLAPFCLIPITIYNMQDFDKETNTPPIYNTDDEDDENDDIIKSIFYVTINEDSAGIIHIPNLNNIIEFNGYASIGLPAELVEDKEKSTSSLKVFNNEEKYGTVYIGASHIKKDENEEKSEFDTATELLGWNKEVTYDREKLGLVDIDWTGYRINDSSIESGKEQYLFCTVSDDKSTILFVSVYTDIDKIHNIQTMSDIQCILGSASVTNSKDNIEPPKSEQSSQGEETSEPVEEKLPEGFIEADIVENLDSGEFILNSKKIKLGMQIKELFDLGFSITEEFKLTGETILKPNDEIFFNVTDNNKAVFGIKAKNNTDAEEKLENCIISFIDINVLNFNQKVDNIEQDYLILPGGIGIYANKDDILNYYGEPNTSTQGNIGRVQIIDNTYEFENMTVHVITGVAKFIRGFKMELKDN